VLHHFAKHGYVQSLDKLEQESGVSLKRWQAADNMDLLYMMHEFKEFYQLKYERPPKYVRKANDADKEALDKAKKNRGRTNFPPVKSASASAPSSADGGGEECGAGPGLNRQGTYGDGNSTGRREKENSKKGGELKREEKPPKREGRDRFKVMDRSKKEDTPEDGNGPNIEVGGASIGQAGKYSYGSSKNVQNEAARERRERRSNYQSGVGEANEGEDKVTGWFEHRLIKPMPDFGSSQLKELADVITRDIYQENPNVRWGDIAGLLEAKQLLKEAVVMPMRYPQFFTGLLAPWKGVLMYGPPGTGKTMLARAVATECRTTFFNISASSIVSKWRGESEKLIRVLFDLARFHAPSTIFLDEMDSIMGRRDTSGEHEASRRMKTELLIQMDGLAKTDDLVFVLAASNHPWDLDMAMLRRLEKRILVTLPVAEGRRLVFEKHLAERSVDMDFADMAARTEGYSGADLVLVCKEAAMRPMRRLMGKLSLLDDSDWDPSQGAAEIDDDIQLEPVTGKDVLAALNSVKPSANLAFLAKYVEWTKDFGAGYSAVDEDIVDQGESDVRSVPV
jgi:katanin p60 ATPase-containing subunit A1